MPLCLVLVNVVRGIDDAEQGHGATKMQNCIRNICRVLAGSLLFLLHHFPFLLQLNMEKHVPGSILMI